jgi:hypothetical protein
MQAAPSGAAFFLRRARPQNQPGAGSAGGIAQATRIVYAAQPVG